MDTNRNGRVMAAVFFLYATAAGATEAHATDPCRMPPPVAHGNPEEFEKTFGIEAQKAIEDGFDLFEVRFSAQVSALESMDADAWHAVGMALYQWNICGQEESVPKSLRESFPEGKLGLIPVLYLLVHANWLGNETSRAVLWHAYGTLHEKEGVGFLPTASAANLFKQAYFEEEAEAQYKLGQRYEKGPASLQPLAIFWWLEAARNGHPDAQSRVGQILVGLDETLLEGSEKLAPVDEWMKRHPTPAVAGAAKRLEKAKKAVQKAKGEREIRLEREASQERIEGKKGEATQQLAQLRESRSAEDARRIVVLLEERARARHQKYNVAKQRRKAEQINRKRLHAEGWDWIEQAAAQDNPESLFLLGARMVDVQIDWEERVSNYAGEPYDSDKAVEAAVQGVEHIQRAVENSEGYRQAKYALVLAKLRSWNLSALDRVGWGRGRPIFLEFWRWGGALGHGLPVQGVFEQIEPVRRAIYNRDEALQWYRYAGNQGHLSILRDLAGSLGSGSKYRIDLWYRQHREDDKRLRRPNPDEIIFELPVYYDPREAARWVRSAALKGHVVAQMELGELYAEGRGVPKDNVSMYAWRSVAASGTLDESEEWSYGEVMAWIREQLEVDFHLSPIEVAQGQALARELFAQMSRESRADASPDTPRQGTGILFAGGTVAVTNHHVVAGCSRVDVVRDGQGRSAAVVGVDGGNDLVLLEMKPALLGSDAPLRPRSKVSVGERAVVAGFPFTSGDGFTVTTGNISAIRGPAGRTGLFQFTAPIQQGNSGGPVIGADGAILGVVVSKLDAVAVAAATGDLPQNVNYAVHGAVLRTFLDLNGVDYRTLARLGRRSDAELADEARRFTVLVTCTPDTQPSGTDP